MKCPLCNTSIHFNGAKFCPSCGTDLANPIHPPLVNRHSKPPFDYIRDFSEGLAMVSSGNKAGYINTTGELVIPMKFDSFSYSSTSKDKYSTMALNQGFPNTNYPWLRPDFMDGLAVVSLSDSGRIQTGCINELGDYIIRPGKRRLVASFTEGLAPFFENDRYGFIDTKDRIVISPQI